jgi:hypothetical protein
MREYQMLEFYPARRPDPAVSKSTGAHRAIAAKLRHIHKNLIVGHSREETFRITLRSTTPAKDIYSAGCVASRATGRSLIG